MTTPPPSDAQPPVPRRPRRVRSIVIQIVGLLAGIASLGWCVSMALRPENRDQWARLQDAPTSSITLLLGLSLAALILEGLIFWIVLRPARRIAVADMLATNAVCTFLAYLPFKVSAILRFVIHNRRDGVPVLTIAAWLGNFGSIMLGTFTALLATLAAVGRISPVWALAAAGASLALWALLVGLGRVFRGEVGIDRLVRVLSAVGLKRAAPLVRTTTWRSLHAGFDMHADARCVGLAIVLRWAHAGVMAWRFVVAAGLLGVVMPWEVALPLGLAFFIIGAASPAGMAGIREGGVTGLAGLLLATGGQTADVAAQYAPVALLVSGTEAVMFLTGALLGLIWLRPDRLLRLRRVPERAEA